MQAPAIPFSFLTTGWVETLDLDADCEESEPRMSVHGAVGVEELDPCRPNVH